MRDHGSRPSQIKFDHQGQFDHHGQFDHQRYSNRTTIRKHIIKIGIFIAYDIFIKQIAFCSALGTKLRRRHNNFETLVTEKR